MFKRPVFNFSNFALDKCDTSIPKDYRDTAEIARASDEQGGGVRRVLSVETPRRRRARQVERHTEKRHGNCGTERRQDVGQGGTEKENYQPYTVHM